MVKNGDDKEFDEHTEVGVTPPKLPGVTPPPARATPATPEPTAAPPPAASLDEQTRVRVVPPPMPPRPTVRTSAPPLDESTRLVAVPPPPPAATPSPATPRFGSSAATPAGEGGDFAEHTILLSDLQQQAAPPARLQRMQPPGRSDVITLDRTHYLMGRLPSCDLRLYSQTASREHAQLTARAGRWYLTPVTGKVVLVDGAVVKEEVPLTHKMRLQLGGDELLFLDETGAPPAAGRTPGAVLVRHRWLAAVITVLALAAVLWMWAIR